LLTGNNQQKKYWLSKHWL